MTGNSTLACEMGVYGVLPMLNYRALSWFYGDITEFGRQTVVHELLVLAVTLSGPYGGGVRWVRTNPPPVATYGKQKLEPNHFVAVQDLIERSELKVSLKH